MDLDNISPDGVAPRCRITDASKAYQIWNNMRIADGASSYERALIDAAYDSARPYDQKTLVSNGQSYRVNVSWGLAKQVLDQASQGYLDIISSVDRLFDCPTSYGDNSQRLYLSNLVSREVTNTIRSWNEFPVTFMRMVNPLVKHGVSVAYFNDEYNWKWKATDLSDFKIPRNIEIGQSNIPVAGCLRRYTLSQLYKMIEDEAQATELGYNVKAIKKAIMAAPNNNAALSNYTTYNWEKWQDELRNNDLYFATGYANVECVRVVHIWWQEFDGRWSTGMINDDTQGTDWLCKKVGRFNASEEIFNIFTFGIGTNGFYHGVRGQGYDIYPIHGALDRAYCSLLELAMYGTAPVFQPKTEKDMQEMQFTPSGPYNLLSPGIDAQASLVPNLGNGVMQALQAFQTMFVQRTANSNTQNLIDSRTEKSAFQAKAEYGTIARMSTGVLQLFYYPWETHLREVVRRIVDAAKNDFGPEDPGGLEILELKKRLLRAGGEDALKALYDLQLDQLRAVKAIGAGSEAARQVAYSNLANYVGSLDEVGRANFMYDVFANELGPDNALRYVQPAGADARPVIDESIAQLENGNLLQGFAVEVLVGQNDYVHAQEHLKAMVPLIQQAQQDPTQLAGVLPGLNNLNQHTTVHVERLSQDPNRKVESAQMRKAIQQADEIIHNGLLHVEKMQREQQGQESDQQPQGQPQGQQPGELPPDVIQKIQGELALREAKIQTILATTQAKIRAKEAETQQALAINDARAAAELRRQLP